MVEGYDVYDRAGESCGRVVEARQDFLIIEAGLLFKTQRAIPRTLVDVDDAGQRIRLLISHELLDDSPHLEAELDEEGLRHYYAQAAAQIQAPPVGAGERR